MKRQLDLFPTNQPSITPEKKLPSADPVCGPLGAVQIAPPEMAMPVVQALILDEPAVPYLSVKAVAQRYAVSTPTIWRWTARLAGFPKPVKVSLGTTRWKLIDLQAYDQARFDHSVQPTTRCKK